MSSIFAILVIFSVTVADAAHTELHKHPEIAIVDYVGPLHKDVFQLLKGTESLEIRNSNITRMDGHMVSELPKLKRISFIDSIVDVDQVDLDNLFHGAIHLKEIYVKNVTCKELRAQAVRETPIEIFSMTDHVYKALQPDMFNETKLKRLILSRDQMDTIEDGGFDGLDKLEILDLDTNRFKSIPKERLAPLKSVKLINLRENLFEKFGTEDLPNLPNLETIDLGFNPLTQLNLDGVEAVVPKLKTIDITGVTTMTNEQIQALKAKYPNISLKTR